MQIRNNLHYSLDPYLLSKHLHKNDEIEKSSAETIEVDLSSSQFEEKLYTKSINASSSLEAGSRQQSNTEQAPNARDQAPESTYQAVESYQNIQDMSDQQGKSNLIAEMV
ncbi:MAG: hypothetical protein QM484_03275 [Woeseiaceae bacterium]